MELKTGYKQTEVGVIPSDWEVKKVGEVFVFYATSNYSKAEMSLEGEIGCFHYGLVHAISNTSFSLGNGVKYYIKSDKTKYEQIKDGDIVMVDASEDLAGVNKSVEVFGVGNKKFIAGLHTYLMRDLNLVLADYFRGQVLNSRMVKTQMVSLAVGMKVFGVSKTQLKEILIPIPTLAEQTAIATALSDTDQYITHLEKLIAKKRNIKQGAMQELLKPKEGWVVKKLGECLTKNPEYGINAASTAYSDNLPTYLRITDISENGTFISENKVSVDHPLSNNYFLEKGDLVFARTGASVGKTYLYDENDGRLVFAGFLIRIRPNPEILNPILFKNLTETKDYWDWVKLMSMRSGQPGINGNEFKQFSFYLPSTKSEQTNIATILSDMDSEISALETKLNKAKGIKQGMMQQLLTGKIRLL